ncbi:MAG: site-2 protease family protein [Oscillospiraceae bacterium]|nr:site-2 protease family protein [Oscillospiraceae bacterium]
MVRRRSSSLKIEIRPSFAVLLGLVIALDPAGLMLPFLLAAALHELGHLVCLRLCGIPVYKLRIDFTGAVLHTASMAPRREAYSAAAGPFVNLLCGLGFLRLCPAFSFVSLLLAFCNLLPIFPLDGGRILRSLWPKAAPAIGSVATMLLFIGGWIACAWLHWGLWPLILPAVLLVKVAVWRHQEQKLFAKSGSSVYNIQRSR